MAALLAGPGRGRGEAGPGVGDGRVCILSRDRRRGPVRGRDLPGGGVRLVGAGACAPDTGVQDAFRDGGSPAPSWAAAGWCAAWPEAL